MDVNGINIYGVTVSELDLKIDKKKIDVDFLIDFCERHEGISWAFDDEGETYIGILPAYPWESIPKRKIFSSYESTNKYLADALKEICSDSEEELINGFDYISSYSLT